MKLNIKHNFFLSALMLLCWLFIYLKSHLPNKYVSFIQFNSPISTCSNEQYFFTFLDSLNNRCVQIFIDVVATLTYEYNCALWYICIFEKKTWNQYTQFVSQSAKLHSSKSTEYKRFFLNTKKDVSVDYTIIQTGFWHLKSPCNVIRTLPFLLWYKCKC